MKQVMESRDDEDGVGGELLAKMLRRSESYDATRSFLAPSSRTVPGM